MYSTCNRLQATDSQLLPVLYFGLLPSTYFLLVSRLFSMAFSSTLPLIRVIDVLKKNIPKGDSCARHKHIFSVHISSSELAEKRGGGD
jgi:hypothetical protein